MTLALIANVLGCAPGVPRYPRSHPSPHEGRIPDIFYSSFNPKKFATADAHSIDGLRMLQSKLPFRVMIFCVD